MLFKKVFSQFVKPKPYSKLSSENRIVHPSYHSLPLQILLPCAAIIPSCFCPLCKWLVITILSWRTCLAESSEKHWLAELLSMARRILTSSKACLYAQHGKPRLLYRSATHSWPRNMANAITFRYCNYAKMGISQMYVLVQLAVTLNADLAIPAQVMSRSPGPNHLRMCRIHAFTYLVSSA